MGRQTEGERTNLKCQLLELDTGRKQKITARIACRASLRFVIAERASRSRNSAFFVTAVRN